MTQHNCIDTIPAMRSSASNTLSLTWQSWLRDGQRLVVAEVARTRAQISVWRTRAQLSVWRTRAQFSVWRARARDRRALAQMDARLLRDIGVSAEQAARETRKPFWQA